MKPRALVTRHVYPAAIPILQEHCVVDYQDSYEVLSEPRLMRKLALAEGVVCQLTDPISRAVIEAAPKLKVISQVAVGYDNIDVTAATERGIVVTNTPGVLTEATADMTFALLLAAARKLPAAERYLRAGKWQRWDVDLLCGGDVHARGCSWSTHSGSTQLASIVNLPLVCSVFSVMFLDCLTDVPAVFTDI